MLYLGIGIIGALFGLFIVGLIAYARTSSKNHEDRE